MHSKGLKFGIYTSAGIKTCNPAGFPGGLGHETSDAQQFADWGVDYLKYDNCNNLGVDAKQRYRTMRDALKATGRPIVYSICEWGENKPWEWASDVGHLWRTTGDISDSWASMLEIAKQNLPLAPHAGPGHWNDPDMLEVGNGGMTDTEYRSHFSLWSMMAAPLLIGSDLRKATPETFAILANKDLIAVDQDALGKPATVLASDSGRWTLVRQLAGGDSAVALFNETDQPQRISTTAGDAGLPQAAGYRLRDLWQHRDTHTTGTVSATVPAHGTVVYRVSADPRWAGYPPAVETGLDRTPGRGRHPRRPPLDGPQSGRHPRHAPHGGGQGPARLATQGRLAGDLPCAARREDADHPLEDHRTGRHPARRLRSAAHRPVPLTTRRADHHDAARYGSCRGATAVRDLVRRRTALAHRHQRLGPGGEEHQRRGAGGG